MNRMEIVISGIGGKGVLFTSRIIVDAAVRKNIPVIAADEIGMSQRGGSVSSHVKIGDFFSPMVGFGNADLLIALHLEEGLRNLVYLKYGGLALFNGDSNRIPDFIANLLSRNNIKTYFIDADKVSLSLGYPRVSNVVMLGFLSSLGVLPFTPDEVMDVIISITPEKLVDINRRAFDAGFSKGKI